MQFLRTRRFLTPAMVIALGTAIVALWVPPISS